MAQKISRKPLEYRPRPGMAPTQNPDLLDQLSYEHRQIERIWTELQRAHRVNAGIGSPVDAARLDDTSQMELGRSLVTALYDHDALELDVLYPAAARVMSAEWADQARTDHAAVRDLLGRVDGRDPEEEDVFDIFTEALTLVMAHIDEEEKIAFPILRVEVPRGELANPNYSEVRALPPPPHEIVDLAAAEREVEAHPVEAGNENGSTDGDGEAEGNGHSNGDDRKEKKRRRLLRR